MCGHVGIAGNLIHKDEATMKRLFLYDYFRGPDSTGLAAIRNNNEVKLAKVASHPLDLFDSIKFREALTALPSHVFIGHNRLATKGVVNNINAHPYQYDHIVGAHNGTLSPSSFKDLEDKLGEKFEVDSKAIFAAIAKFGVEEVIPMLQGAWALVWFDLSNKTLNFLRNKERPFWTATSADHKKLFWASEWQFIRAAVEGQAQPDELWTKPDTGYKFFETEVDTWYQYDVHALKTSTDRYKPKVKELKGKEPAPAANYACHAQGNFPSRTHTTQHGGNTNPSTMTSLGKPRTTTDEKSIKHTVVSLFGDEKDPLAGLFDEYDFIKTAGTSCAWCDAPVDIKDRGITIFESLQACLCAECSGSAGTEAPVRVYATNLRQLMQ